MGVKYFQRLSTNFRRILNGFGRERHIFESSRHLMLEETRALMLEETRALMLKETRALRAHVGVE